MRITIKDLEATCARINRTVGAAATAYTKVSGKLQPNVGNFHLDQAYGGFALHRMANEAGAVVPMFGGGYCTKRELYDKMQAFLQGTEART